MKKKILILLLVAFFATGCTVVPKSNDSIDTIIEEVLVKENNLSNTFFEGYKYYVPRGLTFINKEDFNATLRDQYQNKYYLYVDVVSYYHQIENEYEEHSDSYYSKSLKNGENFGYVEINEVDGRYFVEAMYHYAKVEVYTDEAHLTDVICNVSYLLSSMKYNRNILETLVGENVLDYQEEEFDIFKSKRDESDFLDYVEEFGKYYDKDNQLPDQDKVEIDKEN